MLVRLPFGSCPAADEFCTVSESITDLAQEIVDDKSWDPSIIKSDQYDKIPEPATDNLQKISHAPPIPLWVPITPKSTYMDVYIDSIITITLFISLLWKEPNK